MNKREFESITNLEYKFNTTFNTLISEISSYERKGEPLTLREVLTMGFNNVILDGVMGYDEDDFSDEYLNTKVTFDYWDYDNDNYRNVYLVKYSDVV